MPFTGNTKLTSGIKQKNNLTFALVDAVDVYVEDDTSPKKYKSLKEKLDEIDTSTSSGVDTKITNAINALDVTDAAVSHKFVTAVSETNGKISVTRAQPTVDDISGLTDLVDNKINELDVTDTPVTNRFVTAVSETDGIISVTRAQPTASNISGLTDAINTEINKLDVADTATTHGFVTAVSETNGKIAVTRREVAASDISGLEDAISGKQDNLTQANAGDGISITQVGGKAIIAATRSGTVTDVKLDGVSTVTNGVANIDIDVATLVRTTDSEISDPLPINADTLGDHPADYFASKTYVDNSTNGFVSYDKDQGATDARKKQARDNIGFDAAVRSIIGDASDFVSYVETQSKTAAEQKRARDNLGFDDSVRSIINGSSINAATLNGHPDTYFAKASDLDNLDGYVSYTSAQSKSDAQQKQARDNIGFDAAVQNVIGGSNLIFFTD